MIEISNVIEDGYDDYDETSEEDTQLKEQKLLDDHKSKMEDSDEESDEDFGKENDINFDDEDDDYYEYDEEDEDVNSGLELMKNKLNKTSEYENCFISKTKLSHFVEPIKDDTIDFVINNTAKSQVGISKISSLSSDVIITSEKRNYPRKYEGKSEQFNLKPLHATGKD
jgi:hypothetical protein